MKKIAILGAGPAGMVAAYELSKSDKFEVKILELKEQVGGMAGSFDYNGQIVDFGPHRFFSKIGKANEIFDNMLKENFVKVNRLTRIYYNKKYINYPIQIGDVIKKVSLLDLFLIGISYIFAKISPYKNPQTFEQRIINNFGKKLYFMFFKHYTEKLWGIKCNEIGADWAAQRIKGMSILSILKNAIFKNKMKGKVKSMIDEFKYPKYGNGFLYNNIKDECEKGNVEFVLGKSIQAFNKSGQGFEVNGEFFDSVISTIPIDNLLKLYPNTPKNVIDSLNKLLFRNTILIYGTIKKESIFPDNWIYLHSNDIVAGRLTNFNNWSPFQIKDKSRTYMCLEYWDFDNGELRNSSDEELKNIAEKDFEKICEVKKDDISSLKVIRLHKSYPVYNTGYEKYLDIVRKYIEGVDGLIVVGRGGAFKYNNQDHSMYMGYLAARNLLGEDHDLWSINSDSDYHEEKK